MIKLFKSTDKFFNSNGDKVIKAYKAKVHKEDNGDFYLELECPLIYVDDIIEDAILVLQTFLKQKVKFLLKPGMFFMTQKII